MDAYRCACRERVKKSEGTSIVAQVRRIVAYELDLDQHARVTR